MFSFSDKFLGLLLVGRKIFVESATPKVGFDAEIAVDNAGDFSANGRSFLDEEGRSAADEQGNAVQGNAGECRAMQGKVTQSNAERFVPLVFTQHGQHHDCTQQEVKYCPFFRGFFSAAAAASRRFLPSSSSASKFLERRDDSRNATRDMLEKNLRNDAETRDDLLESFLRHVSFWVLGRNGESIKYFVFNQLSVFPRGVARDRFLMISHHFILCRTCNLH